MNCFLIDFKSVFNDIFYAAKLRVLRSDGAGELNSEEVSKVLQDNGVAQQNSAPNDQFQDGKVERIIGVVNSIARVVMIFSKSQKKLWGYAIRHAAFVLQVLPTSLNEDFNSPFMMINGEKATIKHFIPFGC